MKRLTLLLLALVLVLCVQLTADPRSAQLFALCGCSSAQPVVFIGVDFQPNKSVGVEIHDGTTGAFLPGGISSFDCSVDNDGTFQCATQQGFPAGLYEARAFEIWGATPNLKIVFASTFFTVQ